MSNFQSPFSTAIPFKTGTYNPELWRDVIRGTITILAMVTFLVVVGWYLYEAGHLVPGSQQSAGWTQVKDAMSSVLPAISSVLGTTLGFYFGSQKSKE